MTTHRLPHALPNEEPGAATADLAGLLAEVRRTVAGLLASSPAPPTALTVRAGDVSVELGWAPAAGGAAAPVAVVPAPAPEGETIDAATVGVFHRSPSPGAPPFVAEGDEVSRGQEIAVIEAMKLMLPVEADKGGRVAEVLVADGAAVEYGQPLFRLAAAGEELEKAA